MTDVIQKITVAEFLEAVGRKEFQSETGFSTQLVQRAKTDGVFPAHWIWIVREFCNSHDIQIPEHLFRGHPESIAISSEGAAQ